MSERQQANNNPLMAICKLAANSLAYQLVHTLASTFVYPLHDEFFIPPAVLAWVRYFRYVGNIFVCWCNFWNRVCTFRWKWRNFRWWFFYGGWKIVYVLFLLEFNLRGCEYQNIIVPEISFFKIIIRDGEKFFPGISPCSTQLSYFVSYVAWWISLPNDRVFDEFFEHFLRFIWTLHCVQRWANAYLPALRESSTRNFRWLLK